MKKLILCALLAMSANSFALDELKREYMREDVLGGGHVALHIEEVCVGGYVYVIHHNSRGSSMVQKFARKRGSSHIPQPQECRK